MVPDPSALSRRTVLGSLAGAAAGGTVVVGATRPTALPDVLTDEASKHYPTPPEVSSHWQPTVTESHARHAVERLAAVVEEAEARWADLDVDRHFTGAGGWLETAREDLEAGDYHDALFHAGYGMQFAAEQLGTARARQDDADLQALAERGVALLEDSRRLVEELRPYPVADAGRDLAWYHDIERHLSSARLEGSWREMEAAADGVDDEDGPSAADYDARDVGTITAGVEQGELHLHTAREFRDRLTGLLEGADTSAQADRLRGVADRFREAVDAFPTRQAVESKYVDDDAEVGPYEFAHYRLARWCFDAGYVADREADLLVRRVVELATAVTERRAHGFAVDELVVEPDDEGFDSGHVLAEKRRARRAYRSAFGSDPPALLTRQAARAVEDLQVATVGFADSYQRPLWRERLKAYCYALVGRAKLREHPAVYETVVGE